jgi:hypothetical protein
MLADFYWEMRPDALVVLGSAASGKSAATVLLTLGLLKLRSQHDPAPVHFSLARWDRSVEFRTWLNQQMLLDHPWLRADDVYGRAAGLELLDHKCVIPILDGLDELLPVDQSQIIAAISRAPASGLIVTCREPQYDAIELTGEALPGRVAVVTLANVESQYAIQYLRGFLHGTTKRHTASWDPLLEVIEHDPESSIATSLRSPLNLFLVPKVYKRLDSDPGELLKMPAERIEEHLLARFVASVFDDVPGTPGGRWGSRDARRWLGNLAAMTIRERQIGWWELSKHGRPITAIAAGLFAAAAAGLAVGLSLNMLFNPVVGLVFGGLAAIGLGIWSAVGEPLLPKEIEVGVSGRWTSMLVSFFLIGGIVGVVGTLVRDVAFGAPAGVAFGLLIAVLYGGTGTDPTARLADPRFLLRREIKVAWTYALAYGIFALIVSWLITANALTAIAICVASATAGGLLQGPIWTISGKGPMGVVALGHLVIATLRFAPGGSLPWRVMDFLDDAHQLGVLRLAGGKYEFRHETLRTVLLEHATVRIPTHDDPSRPAPIPEGEGAKLGAHVEVPD